MKLSRHIGVMIVALVLFLCPTISSVWAMSAECETAIAERDSLRSQYEALDEIRDRIRERKSQTRERLNRAREAYQEARLEAEQAWDSYEEIRDYYNELQTAYYDFGLSTEEREAMREDLDSAGDRMESAGRILRGKREARDRAKEYQDNIRATLDDLQNDYAPANRAADSAYRDLESANRRVARVCREKDFQLAPGSVLNDLEDDTTEEDTGLDLDDPDILIFFRDDPRDDYRDLARESNVEDLAIEADRRKNGSSSSSSSSSSCNIGSGTSCTSVSFSMNEGGSGGSATFSLGGVTLASGLASTSKTFNGTAASGQSFTLTITCSGPGCNVDFTALSGASCPTINGQAIAPSGTFTSSCTIN